MQVRLATSEDAAGVGLVHVRAWQAAYRAEIPGAYLDSLDPEDRGRKWAKTLSEPAGKIFVVEEVGVVQGFCAQARAFIDGVKTGRTPHNSLQDAAKTMQLADAIFENATNRKKIG